MNVPFLDLQKINARFENDFQIQLQHLLQEGQYILGDSVKNFEDEFAQYCKAAHCLGVGNGLDALRLILEGYKLLGKLKEGDGVLVAANSFIATVLAIKQAGLKPVFIDVEPALFNIDVEQLQNHDLTGVKAIIMTHLYGQLGPIEQVIDFARAHELLVIEDAAQAHGATRAYTDQEPPQYTKAGNFGHAAAFSFYPTKNLGALGDGGAVVTQDTNLFECIDKLRNYGTSSKYINDFVGFNTRLDAIQAKWLLIKLKQLDADNARRREIALQYLHEVVNAKIKLPFYDGSQAHVFHVFVVQVADRPSFLEHLEIYKVNSLIHYPIPPHKQQALRTYNEEHYPTAEKLAQEVVSIPISPVMTEAQVSHTITCLNAY